MFLEVADRPYRLLLNENEGAWLIACDNPEAPCFLSKAYLDAARRIPKPESVALAAEQKMTLARRKRLSLIQPLLDDKQCIVERKARNTLASIVAEKSGVSKKCVIKLYFQYLATGILTKNRTRVRKGNATFEWAIYKFYFSGKRFSLKGTYEMMLLEKFTDINGNLLECIPTWKSFEHYFYNNQYHRNPQLKIARDGLGNYQRNERPLRGTAMQWREKIGSYQMDETQADIFLVSRFDRSAVIGRPYIYLAVDTASQLIAGIYVGMDAGENAVMACLYNAASDKQTFCRGYGIEIEKDEWPSSGIPNEVITDRGRDFISGRMDEFCELYGVERHTLPPFRPDGKGLVERAFGLIQNMYKPLLRGKGVVDVDSTERWAIDYREQAILNLHEFTQIVVQCVLHINGNRILDNIGCFLEEAPPTPAKRWIWYRDRGRNALLETDDIQGPYQLSLPRENGKMARKGIAYNGLFYIPDDKHALRIGDSVIFGYDTQDISYIYVFQEKQIIRCTLTPSCRRYLGMTKVEAKADRDKTRCMCAEHKRRELESKILMTQGICEIVSEVTLEKKGRQNGNEIRRHCEEEKERLS